MSEPIPNPGSEQAKRSKCKCGVAINDCGRGAFTAANGRVRFVTHPDCPLHGRGSAWASNKDDAKC